MSLLFSFEEKKLNTFILNIELILFHSQVHLSEPTILVQKGIYKITVPRILLNMI